MDFKNEVNFNMKFFPVVLVSFFFLNQSFAESQIFKPETIIKSTTEQVLERIARDKEALKENPGEMLRLVSDLIFPHFDFGVMSHFVMGKNWKELTEEKRQEFIDQFRKLLVRTYASALLEFSDQEISYIPDDSAGNSKTTKVLQQIDTGTGEPMLITYRLHNRSIDWKVFDVSVSGVSLVKTYRASFQSIANSEGIDGLIGSLKEKNEKFGNL